MSEQPERHQFTFNKADAAALRRGVDPWEVRGFYSFLKLFPFIENKSALALAATVIAELRDVTDDSVGNTCRLSKLSEQRLRRLLVARDRGDLAHQLRGIMRIAKRVANPVDIVETIVFWGDGRRRQIAQDYFGGSDE